MHLLGRVLSGLADLVTVYLVYRIGRRLYGPRVGLLAGALLAACVLHIQQAHFFVFDSYLVTLITAGLLLLRGHRGDGALAQLRPGRALLRPGPGHQALHGRLRPHRGPGRADLPVAGLAGGERRDGGGSPRLGRGAPEPDGRRGPPGGARRRARLPRLPALRLRRPRLLRPAPQPPLAGQHRLPGQDPRTARSTSRPASSGPAPPPSSSPGATWSPGAWGCPWAWRPGPGSSPPGWSCLRDGLGSGAWRHLLVLAWAALCFVYFASVLNKTMRYLLPAYPFFILLAAWGLVALYDWARRQGDLDLGRDAAGHLAAAGGPGPGGPRPASPAPSGPSPSPASTPAPSPASAAAQWIYENVPKGSVLANEHWDDPLPMPLPGYDPSFYRGPQLPLYDPDEPKKLDTLVQMLSQSDYINLTSNRLYEFDPPHAPALPHDHGVLPAPLRRRPGVRAGGHLRQLPHPGALDDQRRPGRGGLHRLRPPQGAHLQEDRRLLPGAGAPDPLRGAPGRRAPGAPHPGRADAADDAGGPPRGEHRRGHLVGHVLPGRPGQPPGPPAVVGGPDRPGLARRPAAVAGPAPPPDRGYGLARALGLLAVSWIAWSSPRYRLLPWSRGTLLLAVLLLGLGAGLALRRAGPAGGGSGWPGCARSGGCCWPRRRSSSAPTSCSCSSARPTRTSGTPCGGARSRWSSPTSTR